MIKIFIKNSVSPFLQLSAEKENVWSYEIVSLCLLKRKRSEIHSYMSSVIGGKKPLDLKILSQ